jgi:hypothetical protein
VKVRVGKGEDGEGGEGKGVGHVMIRHRPTTSLSRCQALFVSSIRSPTSSEDNPNSQTLLSSFIFSFSSVAGIT